jgi:hypothetical protein
MPRESFSLKVPMESFSLWMPRESFSPLWLPCRGRKLGCTSCIQGFPAWTWNESDVLVEEAFVVEAVVVDSPGRVGRGVVGPTDVVEADRVENVA